MEGFWKWFKESATNKEGTVTDRLCGRLQGNNFIQHMQFLFSGSVVQKFRTILMHKEFLQIE